MPLQIVWHMIRNPWPTIKTIGSGIRTGLSHLNNFLKLCKRESTYWFYLFLYTSKQFLRVESYLSILGAIAFFGTIIVQDMGSNQHLMLEYCYIYFTIVIVLLAMNLLPRERERGTLEILWSQPMSRGTLIVVQLLTLTIWSFVLCLLLVFFFLQFTAYTDGWPTLLIMAVTTSFAVAAITVLISTFCRHAIATGLVTLLILGIHFFWLRDLGPIMIYYNPIPPSGVWEVAETTFRRSRESFSQAALISELWKVIKANADIIFNRLFLFVLVGFVLDYLFRRLKQTAKWFT